MKQYFQDQWTRLKILSGGYYTPLRWIMVLLGLLILLLWIVLPYTDWRISVQNHTQQNLQKAAKLQAMQKSVKQWQIANVQAKKTSETEMDVFLNAASYAQAQQDLFNLINAELTRNRLRLMTHSYVESAAAPVGEQVAIQLNIQGALLDILKFVSTFTNHPKRLSFPSMQIIKSTDNAILQITMAGYRLKAKSAAPK